MNIQYNRTIWQNDQTPLNAQHMNNVEGGIVSIISAVNLIPNWVFTGTKPSYTPQEIGADPAGSASNAVLTHNSSVSAHASVLAPKIHNHTLSAITDFPVVTVSDNDYALTVVNGVWGKKKLSTVAFSGTYTDLSNRPTVPTATSQLTNDSGYVTLNDIRRTMSGQWSGGAITAPATFTCGFYPSYIIIVEKNGSGVTTDTRTINSDYSSGGTSIVFTDTGFIAQSPANGMFNKTGYAYYWTAVSEGFKSLPSVTNADNGKVLTVVNGAWASDILPKELPTVTVVNNGEMLTVAGGEWVSSDSVPNELIDIEQRLDALEYVPISINTFSNNVGTVEIGSTVTSVALTFITNKAPTTLTLDGTSIAGETSPKELTGLSLTENKTYTLVAGDGTNTATKTTSVTFLRGVYYGASVTGTLNSAFVLALTKSLQSTRAKTFTADAGTNQYIWYACPTSYGNASFKVGGFDGGFTKVSTISFTNASGHVENYDVYKSDNSSLGSTTVVVS